MSKSRKELRDELDKRIKENLERIKHKIMIISNKGGVGKSTVSVNLAYALYKKGNDVGLLDIDIHGPSIVKLLNLEGKHLVVDDDKKIKPIKTHDGLSVVSMATLLESDELPVIWRGPMKLGAIKQFLGDVYWEELDYLIIDSPPGTGDEPLTIVQTIPELDGAVVITTPQEVALTDVKKALKFLESVKIPVLGVVENMTSLTCPHCGKKIELFPHGSIEKMIAKYQTTYFGKIPFDPEVAVLSDKGLIPVEENPESEFSKYFLNLADMVSESVNKD
jgi:Mrp family chromosome partitioning ATPase